ncbi:terminase small subunit [Caudoviricetes sp.]|nr:terminase small subunit [Caudoviricetes sp.]
MATARKTAAKKAPASPSVSLTRTGASQTREEKLVLKRADLEKKAAQIEKLCMIGATDAEIAMFFDVGAKTISRWRTESEAVAAALKIGKATSDQRVERSLFDRAVGCERPMVKVFFNPRTGQVVEHQYMEKYPPDPLSCIFWLKNRKPDFWRERYDNPVTPLEEATALAQETLLKAMQTTAP